MTRGIVVRPHAHRAGDFSDELVGCVQIAFGSDAVAGCRSIDVSPDGIASIDELVAAVTPRSTGALFRGGARRGLHKQVVGDAQDVANRVADQRLHDAQVLGGGARTALQSRGDAVAIGRG